MYIAVQLSAIIKTPRETTFLMDIPLTCKWLQYAEPSLHDISPLHFYSNFSRLDMQQLELPEFDSYKTFDSQYEPSWTGSDATSLTGVTLLILVTGHRNRMIGFAVILIGIQFSFSVLHYVSTCNHHAVTVEADSVKNVIEIKLMKLIQHSLIKFTHRHFSIPSLF